MPGWICRACRAGRTYRRPPANECRTCRPYVRRFPRRAPEDFAQQSEPAAAQRGQPNVRLQAEDRVCLRTWRLSLGSEIETVAAAYVREELGYAVVHSILAEARHILDKASCDGVPSVNLDLGRRLVSGALLSAATARSPLVVDADAARELIRKVVPSPHCPAIVMLEAGLLYTSESADDHTHLGVLKTLKTT